jgi:carbon monoxide dehydrogenase subunit G
MLQETTFAVAAPPAVVWQVLTDVEAWPTWTASVTSVERLDDGPLRVGSRARIAQPRIPTVVWEVGELEEGWSFTWSQGSRLARTTAVHSVEDDGTGGSRVRLSVAQEGIVGSVVGLLYKGLTKRYLAMEAAGLTERCVRMP